MNQSTRTIEEQLVLWKDKCLHAEKETKAMTELADQRRIEVMELRANLSMWRGRAESLEKELYDLRKGNGHGLS